MSLMGKCCCGGCSTISTCNCLPSSYQISFPSFTITLYIGTYTVPAQTITAYKCCFTYDANDGQGSVDRIVYRPSLINIGTYTDTNCSPSVTLPVYFAMYLGISLFNNPATQPCVVDFNFAIFMSSYQGANCTPCYSSPLIIDATNACHFVGTNETCYFLNGNFFQNTFMQFAPHSYFNNCACPTYNALDNCCFANYSPLDNGDSSGNYSQDNQCDLINVNKSYFPKGYVMRFLNDPSVVLTFVIS